MENHQTDDSAFCWTIPGRFLQLIPLNSTILLFLYIYKSLLIKLHLCVNPQALIEAVISCVWAEVARSGRNQLLGRILITASGYLAPWGPGDGLGTPLQWTTVFGSSIEKSLWCCNGVIFGCSSASATTGGATGKERQPCQNLSSLLILKKKKKKKRGEI